MAHSSGMSYGPYGMAYRYMLPKKGASDGNAQESHIIQWCSEPTRLTRLLGGLLEGGFQAGGLSTQVGHHLCALAAAFQSPECTLTCKSLAKLFRPGRADMCGDVGGILIRLMSSGLSITVHHKANQEYYASSGAWIWSRGRGPARTKGSLPPSAPMRNCCHRHREPPMPQLLCAPSWFVCVVTCCAAPLCVVYAEPGRACPACRMPFLLCERLLGLCHQRPRGGQCSTW